MVSKRNVFHRHHRLALSATRASACLLVGLVVFCPGVSARTQEPLVVGSKNFSESHLLGEIFTQLLRAHTDLEVEHKSGLGGTLVCFKALETGQIDVYPEYTGTGWAVVLGHTERISNSLRAFTQVQAECRANFDVEWLQPLGFDNTYAISMLAERAEELGLQRLSDLASVADSLRGGFTHEFMDREDGYPGLSAFYGFDLGEAKGIEHGLAYQAIVEGSIDVMDAYATDGKLLRYGLVVLEDDRSFFPPYQAAPVVRGATLRNHPELADVLGKLAFRLSEERMTELNFEVEVEGRDFTDVAAEFLGQEGLLNATAVTAQGSGRTRGSGSFLAFFFGRWRETLRLVWEHIVLTMTSVGIAALIAVPLGALITRYSWAERFCLGLAGVFQTIPSLALLAFMISVPGLGLSTRSAVVALTLYAVLPILRNTFTGLREVDPMLIDAARGMGLTERQTLMRVQLPMAVGTIMAGVRTATVITIGFATLAAFIGAGGLGQPILTGLYLNDPRLILAGALPAAALALLADALLSRLERRLTPRGMRLAPASE